MRGPQHGTSWLWVLFSVRDGRSFRTPLPPQLLLLGAHLLRVLCALCADPELITSILPVYTIVLFTNVEPHIQSVSDMPVDREGERWWTLSCERFWPDYSFLFLFFENGWFKNLLVIGGRINPEKLMSAKMIKVVLDVYGWVKRTVQLWHCENNNITVLRCTASFQLFLTAKTILPLARKDNVEETYLSWRLEIPSLPSLLISLMHFKIC